MHHGSSKPFCSMDQQLFSFTVHSKIQTYFTRKWFSAESLLQVVRKADLLKPLQSRPSERPCSCHLCSKGASSELVLELNEEIGWVRAAELGYVDRIRTGLEVILTLFWKLRLLKISDIVHVLQYHPPSKSTITRRMEALFPLSLKYYCLYPRHCISRYAGYRPLVWGHCACSILDDQYVLPFFKGHLWPLRAYE